MVGTLISLRQFFLSLLYPQRAARAPDPGDQESPAPGTEPARRTPTTDLMRLQIPQHLRIFSVPYI